MTNFKLWLENDLQNWLRNSMVKYPVYHGTDKPPFENFAFQKGTRTVLFSSFEVQAKGFFFTENPFEASKYGKNIAECYIHLQNPLLDPRRDKHLGIDRLPLQKEEQLKQILTPLIEGSDENQFIDIGVRRIYLYDRIYQDENGMPTNRWIYEAIGTDGIDWDVLDNPEVVKKLTQLGYDGTFVQEDSKFGRSIFIPSEKQIKIIRWVKGTQPEWGSEEEYGVKKIDGLKKAYNPKGFLS